MQATEWIGFKNHLNLSGPGQNFSFSFVPSRDRTKVTISLSDWAGLGPKFQFLFRPELGLGQNFYFYFGPEKSDPCRPLM